MRQGARGPDAVTKRARAVISTGRVEIVDNYTCY